MGSITTGPRLPPKRSNAWGRGARWRVLTILPVLLGMAAAMPEQAVSTKPLKKGARAWENVAAEKTNKYADLEVTRLTVHKVDDDTNRAYTKEVKAFLVDAQRHNVAMQSEDDIDKAMASYMTSLCYNERQQAQRGGNLLSGMNHIFPEWKGSWPRSSRALAAWGRLAGAAEGQPLCRESVALIALHLIKSGNPLAATIVLLSYDGFSREQDWQMLRGCDVAFDGKRVALMYGVKSRGETSKTGQGQGLIVACPAVAAVLQAMSAAAGDQSVFPMAVSTFRRLWWEAVRVLGLRAGPPHSLRHSGAAEFVGRGGSLEACRRRGRWQALSSVQRYTKMQVLVQSRGELTAEQRKAGEDFWKHPARAWRQALEAGPSSELAMLQAKALAEVNAFRGAQEDAHVSAGVDAPKARPPLLVDTEWRARTNGYHSM